jgi:hypothetical protein
MSIDTNKPYKAPKEYEPKNKGFVPKTKPTSIIMIILGGILIVAFTLAVILGAIFGISKIVEAINTDISEPETSAEVNRA